MTGVVLLLLSQVRPTEWRSGGTAHGNLGIDRDVTTGRSRAWPLLRVLCIGKLFNSSGKLGINPIETLKTLPPFSKLLGIIELSLLCKTRDTVETCGKLNDLNIPTTSAPMDDFTSQESAAFVANLFMPVVFVIIIM